MVYEWKQGARYSADAEIIAKELSTIGEAITPDKIIIAAKNKRSELHKCFEWDDTKAGYMYRKEQARNIVQSLIIIPEEVNPNYTFIRAYENVTIGTDKAYVPIGKVLRDEDWRMEVFGEIGKTIENAIRKLESYEDICGMNHTTATLKSRLVAAKELIKE